MEINKARLAAGDRNELLKLARSIRPTTTLSKEQHPLASQFFDDEPSGVRNLDTQELIDTLAGAQGVEHDRWVESMAAAGYAGIALNRPKASGDVTELTAYNGGGRSGWTPSKDVSIASGGKAAGLEAALRKNRAAKGTTATTANSDTGILTALLKEIVKSLIGIDPDSLDSGTVKTRFTAALKKAGSQVQAQVKAITDELEEAKMKAAFTSTGGKWVREGSHLRLAI